MLTIFILLFLSSSAVMLRRDKAILYSRFIITLLLQSKIFGGLLHETSTTQIFQIFLFLISAVIILLTTFILEEYEYLNTLL